MRRVDEWRLAARPRTVKGCSRNSNSIIIKLHGLIQDLVANAFLDRILDAVPDLVAICGRRAIVLPRVKLISS